MPKKPKFSNPVLNREKKPRNKTEQFNLVTKVNSFNAVFDRQKLDEQEEKHIEEILGSNWSPDSLTENNVKADIDRLKAITAEIKSISRQGAFLIGERVVQAREMLKPYRDGTFTMWLESTFGNRRSGYNMLAYYELFTALPNEDLKTKYKIMPQRAAYSLANRRGDFQRKIQIIDKHFNLKSNELIEIVQKEFANRDYRRRKTTDSLINRLLETIDHLVKRRKELTNDDKEEIKYAKKRIQEILKI